MNDNIDVKMEDDGAEDNIKLASVPAVQPDSLRQIKTESRPSPSRRSTKTLHSPSSHSHSPSIKPEAQETVGGDITLKMEPGEPPKLSRRTSQKVPVRPPQLFTHLPDATAEAKTSFDVLTGCTYANKGLGYTEPPLECDCNEEWDPSTKTNNACGEDSDCINRATKMECDPDCGCGNKCQNQRFQRKQYANVSVIKTDKKGYGLRANVDLDANDFIFEYIGEVIGEAAFRRRMHQYDDEGIKHFYFMSLTKGEFVDATKKGNLGRFCNHSCNPNCYVDKWVVGEKLRMGIFAERNIKAGEELVFNYNVDRYGADPQPCYCGEPNCVGFIGGKTQSGERATKLSWQVVEALGLEDADDWDSAVAKKPRKRKTGEEDEEYINDMQTRALDLNGVKKVMATLATCKEKWIIVKLLDRIQECEDENIRFQVIKMHGYRMLNTVLKSFSSDTNVCQQICDILSRFPMLTRNKIADSGIEETMAKLSLEADDEDLRDRAKDLSGKWSSLEMGFRIKKIKRDPNAVPEERRVDRRDTERTRARSRSRSKSPEAPKGPAAPTGPRNNVPQRGPGFGRPPPPFRRPGALPDGWFQAVSGNGSTYYYNATGQTTWQRPTQPALSAPPPPPPKAVTDQEVLQNLINNIIANKKDSDKPSESSGTATPSAAPKEDVKKDSKEERWKSYPEEKRKKLYENTLHPHISYVMNKYKKYISRDDMKRFGKQIAKKLVDSDFKRGRVGDPRKKLDPKQEKMVKSYVKDFFDKVAQKQKERKRYEEKHGIKKDEQKEVKPDEAPAQSASKPDNNAEAADDVQLSENEMEDEDDEAPAATPATSEQSSSALKRPHDGNGGREDGASDDSKRPKTEAPPPPPPPPPPADDSPFNGEMQVDTTPKEGSALTNGHNGDAMDVDSAQQAAFSSGYQSVTEEKASSTSPMQMATPPTTGSTEQDTEKRSNGTLQTV
ncbi:hypothetical protein BDZ85DRAFT_124574 [Elsinoe ampelina]|uniref:Histone-lysine N-methyltransferase, H3 lysine-36 specific n=1 Tax=Elsinoe ampelina TaxID=302913 RepID=A0A6A6GC52_9PEZI|nr:hypothetical protein BDZ85DRAFT_124574 [Elsinoe ampelina]